ncbi:hypothetical protein MFRU_040g00510 [Monilinia fructicola]|nr:hypothetical protein MFRU_040g00510 [Monilinia fructicola]
MNTYSSTRSLTMMQFTQDPSSGLVNSNPDAPAYISLKILFESLYIAKILFDVRDISHFLFTQCNIALAGVRDLQLIELAVNQERENNLRDLTKCVDLHSPLPDSTKAEWATAREFVQNSGMQLRGKNPMGPEVMQYYAGEVSMLPGLYKRLREKLSPHGQSFWRSEIEIATEDRIEKSKSLAYDLHGKDKMKGPWANEYIQDALGRWNNSVLEQTFYEQWR